MFEMFSLNPLETLPGTPIKNPVSSALGSMFDWLMEKPETKDKATEISDNAKGERQDIWKSVFDSSLARYFPTLSKFEGLYNAFNTVKDVMGADNPREKLMEMAKDPEKMIQNLDSFFALSLFAPNWMLKPMTDWIKETSIFKFLLNAYDSYATPEMGVTTGTALGAVAAQASGGGMIRTGIYAAAGGAVGGLSTMLPDKIAPAKQNWKERIESDDENQPQAVVDFLRVMTSDAHGLAALLQNMFSSKTEGTPLHFPLPMPGLKEGNPIAALFEGKPAQQS